MACADVSTFRLLSDLLASSFCERAVSADVLPGFEPALAIVLGLAAGVVGGASSSPMPSELRMASNGELPDLCEALLAAAAAFVTACWADASLE